MKWDGHSHTEMCRHGSREPTANHVRRAIELGFNRLSITEHAPLPSDFLDDVELRESISMRDDEIDPYFAHLDGLKREFGKDIEILSGLEFDFLPGRSQDTYNQIESLKHHLEDGVLSIHFLRINNSSAMIDFTPDNFRKGVVEHFGSVYETHAAYWREYKAMAELCASLSFKPKLGHPFLIHKFIKAYPLNSEESKELDNYVLTEILPIVLRNGLKIDYNFSGIDVALCGNPYVPDGMARKFLAQGVELIYGSDAHSPKHIGRYYERFHSMVTELTTTP